MNGHPILPDSQRIRAIALGLTYDDDGDSTADALTPDEPQVDTVFHFGPGEGGAEPPPALPPSTDLALMQPAYGPDPDTALKREVRSYQWGRATYHEFIDRLTRIDASIEHPLAIDEMRAYVMRMAIAYSGHPDARIAVKALDMLARMKPIGLYDEKRHRDPNEMTPEQVTQEIRTLLRSMR